MNSNPSEKTNLHPRNAHRSRYDFKALIKTSPALKPFVFVNEHRNETIEFANPEAVKELNAALLKHFYAISYWEIPENYLCPPIPGRADYIHYIADLLSSCNGGKIPTGKNISVFDIGVGANCVYPIIGNKEYGWKFVGSEIDPVAVTAANEIIQRNISLKGNVECRLQKSAYSIFKDVVKAGEQFDLSICNPPFHASEYEAQAATQKKSDNLGYRNESAVRNFGGQKAELWTPGGEAAFINRMINESVDQQKNIFWFTTLVSKRETLDEIKKTLHNVKALDIKTVKMSQGNKSSRIVAWTFFSEEEQNLWREKRWKE